MKKRTILLKDRLEDITDFNLHEYLVDESKYEYRDRDDEVYFSEVEHLLLEEVQDFVKVVPDDEIITL